MRIVKVSDVSINPNKIKDKLPIIHKVLKDGSSETICGIKFPKNTTCKDELVTCNKCKRMIKNKIVHKITLFKKKKKCRRRNDKSRYC